MPAKAIELSVSFQAGGSLGKVQAIIEPARGLLNSSPAVFSLRLEARELRLDEGKGIIMQNMREGDRVFKR